MIQTGQNASVAGHLISEYANVVRQQIAKGVIVCPATRKRLTFTSDFLITDDGKTRYRSFNGSVPMLIDDPNLVEEYARSSEKMNREYTTRYLNQQERWYHKLRRRDYRTKASMRALQQLYNASGPDAVCVSIGGGPARAGHRFLNLNIAPFPNVDIVADAHKLPYADSSVDAIYCEAVFEHLHSPVVAANEVCRVLKKGGKAFVCTPFLQPYHGYPHHYQNFTLTGHVNLFERAGLKVAEAGACVGPTYTMTNMVAAYFSNYLRYPLNKVFRMLWGGVSVCLTPIDILLGDKKNGHIMASTTYLIAEKS